MAVNASVKFGGGSWDSLNCPYTVPDDLRPKKEAGVPMVVSNGGSHTGLLVVNPSGLIRAANLGSSGSNDDRVGYLTWFAGV